MHQKGQKNSHYIQKSSLFAHGQKFKTNKLVQIVLDWKKFKICKRTIMFRIHDYLHQSDGKKVFQFPTVHLDYQNQLNKISKIL